MFKKSCYDLFYNRYSVNSTFMLNYEPSINFQSLFLPITHAFYISVASPEYFSEIMQHYKRENLIGLLECLFYTFILLLDML